MEIEFVAFVKMDYYESAKTEEVFEALEEIYGEEGEQYSGPTFGGGGWSQRVFGNGKNNPLQADEDIRWIRTIVDSNVRGILDVVTLGLLSRKKIDEILEEEESPPNEYNQFKGKLRDLIGDIPSVVDGNQGKAYFTYIEPNEEFHFRSEGELNVEKIQGIIEENTDTLSRFEYYPGGYHTLYQGNYVLTSCVSNNPYSRVSIFTRGIDREHNAPEELRTRPVWYSGIEGLVSYFRAYYWSEYRNQHISRFDGRISENRDDWISSFGDNRDTDVLLETAREIHGLQLEWVDIYTNVVDEVDHLRFIFQPTTDDGNDDDADRFWPEPVEIPPPDGQVIPTRPEGERDLVSIYTSDIRNRLKVLQSEVERVDEKVRKLSSNLHDVITVGSTEESISLQKRIRKLTLILIILTVVLVILTGAIVFIELA